VILSPLTKNKDVSLLSSINAKQLIDDWKGSFAIDITKELAGIPQIDLYRCNETGLRFFVPASVAGGEHLYTQLQKFEWYYMPWKWEHEALYSRLKAEEKILEVGCATGSFVERLCSDGFDAEGIEFNLAAVAKAQDKKLPVSTVDLVTLANSKPMAYDVVCSFQVLEHVSDPAAFISGCIALLKPKGRLVICVPNNDSFLKYQYSLLDMPPHHMTQWSVNAFRALEKLYPLRLAYVRYEPLAQYHIDGYIFAHKKRLLEASSFFRLFLNRYTLPLARFVLHSGLRRFCRGQSIYVEFIKL
jgi:SAM-dependent methyltransferase